MIGESAMAAIASPRIRHVARLAIVVPALSQPGMAGVELRFMTGEALRPEVLGSLVI
jgi:hypothetical protein